MLRWFGLLCFWALAIELLVRVALIGLGVRWPRFGDAVDPHFPPLSAMQRPGGSKGFEVAYRHDPLLGWTNRPRSEVVNDVQVTVDEQGRRVLGGPAPAEADWVVAFVGDSFTFGTDVGDAEVWLTELQARHPRTAIVDLGVPIQGPDQMWLTYQQNKDLQPDVVVMGLLGVDLFRAQHDFVSYRKPLFQLSADGELSLTSVPVPPPEEVVAASRWRSRGLDVLRMMGVAFSRAYVVRDDQHALPAAIVAAFIDEVRRDGAQVRVLGLPDGRPEDDGVPWFREVCEDEACVPVDPDFGGARAAGVEVLGPWAHWTPAGHQRIAARVDALLGSLLDPP